MKLFSASTRASRAPYNISPTRDLPHAGTSVKKEGPSHQNIGTPDTQGHIQGLRSPPTPPGPLLARPRSSPASGGEGEAAAEAKGGSAGPPPDRLLNNNRPREGRTFRKPKHDNISIKHARKTLIKLAMRNLSASKDLIKVARRNPDTRRALIKNCGRGFGTERGPTTKVLRGWTSKPIVTYRTGTRRTAGIARV